VAESRDEQVTSRRSAAADVQLIKEQIARTRDRMAATIDTIQYRLDPARGVNEGRAAWPYASRVGAADRAARKARIVIRAVRFVIAICAIVRAESTRRRRGVHETLTRTVRGQSFPP